MLFIVIVEDSDYCHKNIKSDVTSVVHSQMPSCIYILLPLLRHMPLKNKLKKKILKKGTLDKSHEKGRGLGRGEEINLKVLEKEYN